LTTRIAPVPAVIQKFHDRVAAAVADAYVDLLALGLDDAQAVALLGLPPGVAYPMGIQEQAEPLASLVG
jgi:hypothetical protein